MAKPAHAWPRKLLDRLMAGLGYEPRWTCREHCAREIGAEMANSIIEYTDTRALDINDYEISRLVVTIRKKGMPEPPALTVINGGKG